MIHFYVDISCHARSHLTFDNNWYDDELSRYVNAMEFETAGHMDRDAEIYLYTSVADVAFSGPPRHVDLYRVKQSILVSSTDIYEVGKLVLDHTIFGPKPRTDLDVQPEIALVLDGDGEHEEEDVTTATMRTATVPPTTMPKKDDDDGTEIEC